MNKYRVVVLAVAALSAVAVASVSASANGRRSIKDEPYRFSWTGFYIGGQLGYGWSDVDWTSTQPAGVEQFSHDPSGFVGGGHIGLQGQWGSWVAGVELSLLGTDLNESQPGTLNPAQTVRIVDLDNLFLATARLGYAWDRSLAYVKGGYASGRLELTGRNVVTGNTFSTRDTEHGWTVGVGYEQMIWPNVVAGLEYNYINLDVDNRSGVSTQGTPGVFSDVDASIHTLMARLSYRFGN